MDSINEKLSRCFALTFTEMSPTQYPAANSTNTKGWDSMAQITILSLIAEEFEIDLDFEEFEGAESFEELANRISEICSRA